MGGSNGGGKMKKRPGDSKTKADMTGYIEIKYNRGY